ncbi:hypothetical protein RRG08_025266 [Elysia crispata]|uniref:C-type lectin domain-containing protein n=1 Tax=Elysia crispata TaxID=231223 RepID=A0AAE1AAR4_9GAST|nr:hypothetical protein RRG08_025266 [Elysia crispata]
MFCGKLFVSTADYAACHIKSFCFLSDQERFFTHFVRHILLARKEKRCTIMLERRSKQVKNFTLLLVLLLGTSIKAKDDMKYFKAHGSPQMLHLDEAPITGVRSRLVCSSLCARRKPHCLSFKYDKKSLTCTLGSWIYYDDKKKNSGQKSDVDIYTSACCPAPAPALSTPTDFNLKVFNNITLSRCIFKDETKRNYREAQRECAKKGARLMTAKTQEHYDMFWTLGTDETWLGLDDLDNEGEFKWSDGSVLTQECRENVLNTPDFNNHDNNEDCVHIWNPFLQNRKLNDGDCLTKKIHSVCEIITPVEKKCQDQLCPQLSHE